MVSVPRLADGGLVVCIGTGPSLTREDVESCQGRTIVIAVNDAYLFAPWAAALMAIDANWWRAHHGVPTFPGLKYALQPVPPKFGVTVLQHTGTQGIQTDPTGLCSGHNSGYAALNLAVHFGAAKIVLLGYDMQIGLSGQTHFFGDHPTPLGKHPPFERCLKSFALAAPLLKARGIEVLNCTPGSALTSFPFIDLSEALAMRQEMSA